MASATRRRELLAELDALVVEAPERMAPFDAAAARVWGECVEEPELRRRPRSYPDTLIAAIALAHGLTVVTRNTEDFPGVSTLNLWSTQPFLARSSGEKRRACIVALPRRSILEQQGRS